MRLPARIPIQLKGIFWGSGSRWFLRGAEVWMGNEYLGDISAEWLAERVEEKIRDLASLKRFEVELEPHRLGIPAPDPTAPPRDLRRDRRQSRRGRSKDKGKRI